MNHHGYHEDHCPLAQGPPYGHPHYLFLLKVFFQNIPTWYIGM